MFEYVLALIYVRALQYKTIQRKSMNGYPGMKFIWVDDGSMR